MGYTWNKMAVSFNLSIHQHKNQWMFFLNRIFKKCISYSPLIVFSDYLADILSNSFCPDIPLLITLKKKSTTLVWILSFICFIVLSVDKTISSLKYTQNQSNSEVIRTCCERITVLWRRNYYIKIWHFWRIKA